MPTRPKVVSFSLLDRIEEISQDRKREATGERQQSSLQGSRRFCRFCRSVGSVLLPPILLDGLSKFLTQTLKTLPSPPIQAVQEPFLKNHPRLLYVDHMEREGLACSHQLAELLKVPPEDFLDYYPVLKEMNSGRADDPSFAGRI